MDGEKTAPEGRFNPTGGDGFLDVTNHDRPRFLVVPLP